jgi:pyruvate formate lyase activating enzyme
MTRENGNILHLQRLSTEDGPGIRTTVFFKGCPLRCEWCHNPESLLPQGQVQWMEKACIGCHTCLSVCTRGALVDGNGGISIDRSRCDGCGMCAAQCPTNAMECLGKQVTVDGLLAELVKDRAFYEKSGGGVTLSGGEPTAQPGFAEAFARRLFESGLDTALDTCGLCAPEILGRLLPWVSLVLFDLKLIDPTLHRQYTGQGNELILENAQRVAAARKRLWIRTPLIPGATDQKANIWAIGQFIADKLGASVERWELCAFNNLCRDKYRRLGMEWKYAGIPIQSRSELDEIEGWAKSCGFDPARVFVTGVARVGN